MCDYFCNCVFRKTSSAISLIAEKSTNLKVPMISSLIKYQKISTQWSDTFSNLNGSVYFAKHIVRGFSQPLYLKEFYWQKLLRQIKMLKINTETQISLLIIRFNEIDVKKYVAQKVIFKLQLGVRCELFKSWDFLFFSPEFEHTSVKFYSIIFFNKMLIKCILSKLE